jgi:transcriptional regulator GlxA family with amidase domain
MTAASNAEEAVLSQRSIRSRGRSPTRQAAILLFDGFDELDAIGPFEVLSNARDAGAAVEVMMTCQGGPGDVVASHGLRVHAPYGLPDDVDLVIVPGGGWNEGGPVGVRAEVRRGILPSVIASLHDKGATVASVCTGAMVVAAAGLARNRPATTHHGAREDLAAAGASLVEARVVDTGDVIMAGGVTAGLDLALWLVEREWGADLARVVAEQMEYERTGTVWRAST